MGIVAIVAGEATALTVLAEGSGNAPARLVVALGYAMPLVSIVTIVSFSRVASLPAVREGRWHWAIFGGIAMFTVEVAAALGIVVGLQ